MTIRLIMVKVKFPSRI